MALNIKDRATEEIVRQLAKRTGRSITETVKQAAMPRQYTARIFYIDAALKHGFYQIANGAKTAYQYCDGDPLLQGNIFIIMADDGRYPSGNNYPAN